MIGSLSGTDELTPTVATFEDPMESLSGTDELTPTVATFEDPMGFA
jgi:hypothetical protein